MNKLRGSGSTFSTSGNSWKPFRFNPKVAGRNAKLRRLKQNGLTPPTDKASLRAAANEAALKWQIPPCSLPKKSSADCGSSDTVQGFHKSPVMLA